MEDSNEDAPPSLAQRLVFGRNPRWTLIRLLIWILLLVVGTQFIVRPVKVQGISMFPTYKNGQINFIFRWAYSFNPPHTGDVVAIRYAGEHVMLLKRVIGVPGQTVGFFKGRVVVDGEFLEEPYLKETCNWTRIPVKLGPDEYFVVGDNRSMPMNDHTFGVASKERIVGKALL